MLRTSVWICVCLLLISCAMPMAAQQAAGASTSSFTRAFNGYYKLSNVAVAEDSSQVHVTMTLTLRNAGKTEVAGGIVAVLSSEPNPVLIGSFSAIKTLPSKGQATLSKTFTISAAEYKSWQHGHAPVLRFLVPSGSTAIAAGIQAYQFVPPAKGTD